MWWPHHLQELRNLSCSKLVWKISQQQTKPMAGGGICLCNYSLQFNKWSFRISSHSIVAWNLTSVSNRTVVYKTFLDNTTEASWCIITLRLLATSQIWLLARISSIPNLEILTCMRPVVLNTRYPALRETEKLHQCLLRAIIISFIRWVLHRRKKWIGSQTLMFRTFHWAILW